MFDVVYDMIGDYMVRPNVFLVPCLDFYQRFWFLQDGEKTVNQICEAAGFCREPFRPEEPEQEPPPPSKPNRDVPDSFIVAPPEPKPDIVRASEAGLINGACNRRFTVHCSSETSRTAGGKRR